MKKILFIIFLAFAKFSFAQDSTNVKRTEQYAELIATAKFLSIKVNIVVDYGEQVNLWKDNRVKNDKGKVETFNTVVDAMNYMNSKGWEFVNAFPISGGAGGSVYHFFFRKKIE